MLTEAAIVTSVTQRVVRNPLHGQHIMQPPKIHAMIFYGEAYGLELEIICPNSDYSTNNPALCTLAFLGARPSRPEDAVGKALPYVYDSGGYFPSDSVINTGEKMLENAAWFNPDA